MTCTKRSFNTKIQNFCSAAAMSSKKTFYITTPIFYPNANLHMGHAYTTTISDILARYHRLIGEDVRLLTGSDENTQKMVDAAHKEGKEPLQFLDGIVSNFITLYKSLNISYDQFIRTTDQNTHWPGAIELWEKIQAAGDLYEKEYEGLYCTGHEAFLTSKDLIDGKCPDHGTTPELVKEKNYFFKLSRFGDMLKEKIEKDELKILPESRKGEILAFISQGLEDVSFSRPRRKDWPDGLGIPVPGDDSQVMYVWCDALANYITALGYGRGDNKLFKKFWPADVHVIGKDILRFHAAIWPAMLLSAGIELPQSILVHGFITSRGKKMSKTLGNVIDPNELLADYGTDAVRYYLARHISPFEDGDLTLENFKDVYNGELANGLGNLASRIMQMSSQYLETVPEIPDLKQIERLTGTGRLVLKQIGEFQINRAMFTLWSWITDLDGLIQEQKPFEVVKTNKIMAGKQVAYMVKQLAEIAVLLEPFMPDTSKKIVNAIRENKKPENLFPRKD